MTTVFVRVWRRYWPLNFLAIVILVVVVLFASFLHRAQDRQRAGTCAILDRLPANIDPGVDKARALYDCGAPKPPILFFGHPFPTPTVKPHHVTRVTGTQTIVIVPGTTPSSARSTKAPKPARTAPVTPAPVPTPPPNPKPSICVPDVTCLPSLPQN